MSYNAAAIRQPICARFGPEPETTGSGPNQIQYGTKIGSITINEGALHPSVNH